MKLRKLSILFLIVLAAVLQSTILNQIQILNIKPDILLILLAFFALYYGRTYGLVIGALCGFFSEFIAHLPTGILVFSYSLAGLALGHLGRWVYPTFFSDEELLLGRKNTGQRQRIMSEMVISFIFILITYTLVFLLLVFAKKRVPLLNTCAFIILPSAFYSACTTPAVFSILKIIVNTK